MLQFETHYAPAELASAPTLQGDYLLVSCLELWRNDLLGHRSPVFVLNPERQVVVGNRAFLALLGSPPFSEVVGRRTGELLHCDVCELTIVGCGTSAECRDCLALRAVQRSTQTGSEHSEVSFRVHGGHQVTGSLTATLLPLEGRCYTVVTLYPGAGILK